MTAIVLTLDEEDNIERCIESLGWASQVLVIDSGSSDGTVELASRAGADVVYHQFEGYGSQRQWAMTSDLVEHDWVYFVDADEWVSHSLASEIASVLAAPSAVGFIQRRRFVFQGRWIRHAGWYRGSWLMRLVRRDAARVSGEISERLEVDGRTGVLANDLVDEDLKPFHRWLTKHNSYSSQWAEEMVELKSRSFLGRAKSALAARPVTRIPRQLAKSLVFPLMPFPSTAAFVYLYVVRGGFLDGRVGLQFCALRAFQVLSIRLKAAELRRRSNDRIA